MRARARGERHPADGRGDPAGARARAMGRMLDDPARRARSGAALGEHAREHYSLDRVVEYYAGLLREVAVGRGGGHR